MIPIGTILFAFNEYDSILFCDGRKLPINEYKGFADFCIKQYGKANYFGGDGIKFIGLPNIQGCSIVVRDIENRTEETDNTKDNVNGERTMKLIVDISKELYRQVKDPGVDSGYVANECYNAIYKGIPLDKFLETYNYRDKGQEET